MPGNWAIWWLTVVLVAVAVSGQGLVAPTHYRYSWSAVAVRCSYSLSSGEYLHRSTLTGATSVGQSEVDQCAALCNATLQCGFFHPIQLTTTSTGSNSVVCALYTQKQPKSSATQKTASAGTQKVVLAYGFTRSTPVRVASISQSTTTTTTTTTTTSRRTTTSTKRKTTSTTRRTTTFTSTFTIPTTLTTSLKPSAATTTSSSSGNSTFVTTTKSVPTTTSSASSTSSVRSSPSSMLTSSSSARTTVVMSPASSGANLAVSSSSSSSSSTSTTSPVRSSTSASSTTASSSSSTPSTTTLSVSSAASAVDALTMTSTSTSSIPTSTSTSSTSSRTRRLTTSSVSPTTTTSNTNTVSSTDTLATSTSSSTAPTSSPSTIDSSTSTDSLASTTSGVTDSAPTISQSSTSTSAISTSNSTSSTRTRRTTTTTIKTTSSTTASTLPSSTAAEDAASPANSSSSASSTAASSDAGTSTTISTSSSASTTDVPAATSTSTDSITSAATSTVTATDSASSSTDSITSTATGSTTSTATDSTSSATDSTSTATDSTSTATDSPASTSTDTSIPTTASTTDLLSLTMSTSTTSASATPTIRASPRGATLLQFKGCSSTNYTIPMFVSKNYPNDTVASTASTVWIVQHGAGRNFNDSFASVYKVVNDTGVVIAPNFYAVTDASVPTTWYNPNTTMAWDSNNWYSGADAIAPADVGACSSMDVYDTLIASLRDTTRYPNLQRIFIVAHSGGASMMARYGMLTTTNTDVHYVLANSPAMPYFTTARPVAPQNCKYYTAWGYGWSSSLPRYVAARTPGGPAAFARWVAQDVTLMTGDLDTYSRDPSGDQSCYALAQGGQNRRDRGYAFWAYLNLLAATNTDVSAYYGYDTLKSQVTNLAPPSFNMRFCVVDGVAHDNNAMYASECGRAAITGNPTLPPGPGPIQPA